MSACRKSAAAKQDAFWPWLDFVFARQHALEREDLIGYTAELGLDVEAFIEDLDSDEVAARVQRDIASAEASGAKMTPTFFIDGCRMVGSYDARSLTEMLESSRRGSRTQAA